MRNITDCSSLKADLLLETGRIQEAFSLLTAANELAESENYYPGKRMLYPRFAKVYGALDRWEEAAENWKIYVDVLDTLNRKESLRQQNELLVVYETEKKEKALSLKQNENKILKQEARITALRLRAILIGSILLLGIGILVFIIYRQINLRKHLLQEKEKRMLEQELEFKKRELTTHSLHLVSKNKLLTELKGSIDKLKEESQDQGPFRSLIGIIDRDLKGDKDWLNFERYFKQVYSDFDEKIKRAFSELTGNEIRLVTLMKMNLTTKEIATILNITPESVNKARYRLRKKLKLSTDQNLQQFILVM